MPRLPVSTGIFMNYTAYGNGPPLVLIEGVQSGWVWYKNIPALSRNFRVIVLENRGTGLSDKPPGPYSVPVMARETAEAIYALGLGPAHIMAMSLGGSVAQEVALSYPALVRKLVLVGSTAGGWFQFPSCPYGWWLQTYQQSLRPAQNIRRTLPVAVSPRWLLTHPAEFEAQVAMALMLPTPPYARDALYRAGAVWQGSADRAPLMRAPILAVNGGLDLVSPVANAFWLTSLLPTASLLLYPWSGHLVNVEHSDHFNDTVLRYLLA